MLPESSNRVLEIGRVYFMIYDDYTTDSYHNLVTEITDDKYLGICLLSNYQLPNHKQFSARFKVVDKAALVKDLGTYDEFLQSHAEYLI